MGLMRKWRRNKAAYIGVDTPEYGRSSPKCIPTIPLAHRVCVWKVVGCWLYGSSDLAYITVSRPVVFWARGVAY